MRAKLLIAGAVFLFSSMAYADPPVAQVSVECNWGKLTMEAARENGRGHGQHASDPSGDGHGPGTDDEPRAGLANVLYQGNLQATCEFIESMLVEE